MRKRYSCEFVEDLVAQVLRGEHTLTAIAHRHGVHPGVLSKWVKRQRPASDLVPALAENEVVQLRERVLALEVRVETLRCVLEKYYSHKYS